MLLKAFIILLFTENPKVIQCFKYFKALVVSRVLSTIISAPLWLGQRYHAALRQEWGLVMINQSKSHFCFHRIRLGNCVFMMITFCLVCSSGGEEKRTCHALTLEILFILYVWLGQGVTQVGKSMFSISLFLAMCGSQLEAAVYCCLWLGITYKLSFSFWVLWDLVFCLVS